MQNQTIYKDAFVAAFMNLYQLYQTDQIYACALVLNKFLLIDNLAISTQRSILPKMKIALSILREMTVGILQSGGIAQHLCLKIARIRPNPYCLTI